MSRSRKPLSDINTTALKEKEKYYKLDEPGYAGSQKERSASSKKYQADKTAGIFKSEKEKRKAQVRKAS